MNYIPETGMASGPTSDIRVELDWALGEGYDYYRPSIIQSFSETDLIDYARAPEQLEEVSVDPQAATVNGDLSHQTDRVLLSNKGLSDWLIQQLSDESATKVTVSRTSLENGITRYQVSNVTLKKASLSSWKDLTRNVSYRELMIKVDEFPEVKYDDSIIYETADQHSHSNLVALREWRNLILHLLRVDLRRSIEGVVQINERTFRPVGSNGSPIYVSSLESSRVQIMLKLEQYYGWRYISDNSLVEWALDKLNEDVPLKTVNGVYMIPFDRKYNSVAMLVPPMVSSMIANGMNSIEISDRLRHDNNLLNMALELLNRFGHQVIKRPTSSSRLIIQSGRGAYRPASLTNWLMDSISLIAGNQLPNVVIQCEYPLIGYDRLEQRKAIMWYAALQAYSRLIDKYKYLSTSLYRVHVNDDLSVTVPLSHRQEIIQYKGYLRSIMMDFTPGSWNIFEVDTLRDAVICRWVLYHEHQINSIVFNLPSSNQESTVYQVVTDRYISPQRVTELQERIYKHDLSGYMPRINASIESSFTLSALDLSNVVDRSGDYLLTIMLNYVPIIDMGNNGQDVTLQMINSDSFLREAKDPVGGPINLFINPHTKRPISRTSVSRVLTYQYGLMGWFDIGGDIEGYLPSNTVFIPGLEREAPTRYLHELEVGQVEINGLLPKEGYEEEFIMSVRAKIGDAYSCNTELQDLVSSSSSVASTSVDIDVSHDKSVPLFDLAYRRLGEETESTDFTRISKAETTLISKLNDIVAWLWRRGWFLSLWTTAIVASSDDNGGRSTLSCADNSYAYPLDDVLKNSARSAEDGRWAIRYLNIIVQTL